MTQKVLLVTGGSRGIGAGIARLAATSGWSVCINYRTANEEANAVASQINHDGGRAITVAADTGDEEAVDNMFQIIDRELGMITGLVNNAGINGNVCRVDEIDPAISLELLRVNVLGYFICAKHAIRRMAKRYGGNGGVIVNVSSAASRHGGPGSYIDYAASKAAVDTFTIGLAKEQADQGIRVNTLRPGATMTELSTAWANENPDWLHWVMAQVPMKRPAEVEEIANAALFLLSEKASYMTGATLDVSGGWVSP